MKAANIHDRKIAIIKFLRAGDGKIQNEHKEILAKQLRCGHNTITRDVAELIKRGYIKRLGWALYEPAKDYIAPEDVKAAYEGPPKITRRCMRCRTPFETTKNGWYRCQPCHNTEGGVEMRGGLDDVSYRVAL